MADKHLDDEGDHYGDSPYDDDEEYDDGGDTEEELFEFNETSEYVKQMDVITAKEKHQAIVAAAAERDLTDPDSKQLFLQDFRAYFKQKATDDFSLLHSLAREMYDKSDDNGRHDYKKYIPFLDILLDDLKDLPTCVDSQQRTALHIVVEARQSEVATYLCDRITSDPDLLMRKKKGGDTVIHIAVRENLDCVEHFVKRALSKGPKWTNTLLSIQGEDGNTPLHIAVEYQRCYGKQYELAKLLLDASDAPLSKENKNKLSPFRYHAETQRTARAQQLHTTRPKPPSSSDRTRDKSPGVSSRILRQRKGPLGDKDASSKSSSPAPMRSRPPGKRNTSEQSQRKADPEVATAIQDLMLRQCLRTRTRDEATRILYGQVALRQIDFDLEQKRNSSIEAEDLYKIATHLKFEPALQYVAIPQLELENFPEAKWRHEPFWNSAGRKDYLAIFDWLYERGVRHIFRVIVVDHEDRPHSDAVIIKCLERFNVERLDWKRFDLSSRALICGVPTITQLKLYCSGNEAILHSWAAESGLVNLKQLTKIEVDMLVGLETQESTKDAVGNFENEMQKIWEKAWKREAPGSEAYTGRARRIEVLCTVKSIERARKTVSPGDTEKKHDLQYEQRELWMDCMKAFANFIQDWKLGDREPEIKVAIIDDGVDSTYQDLNKSIKNGESCSIRNESQGLWNPYYHSANGYGTVMACLIRQMCPNVQLYVANVKETIIQGKLQVKAASAAKVRLKTLRCSYGDTDRG
jgi:ankyrin repeat protein